MTVSDAKREIKSIERILGPAGIQTSLVPRLIRERGGGEGDEPGNNARIQTLDLLKKFHHQLRLKHQDLLKVFGSNHRIFFFCGFNFSLFWHH